MGAKDIIELIITDHVVILLHIQVSWKEKGSELISLLGDHRETSSWRMPKDKSSRSTRGAALGETRHQNNMYLKSTNIHAKCN